MCGDGSGVRRGGWICVLSFLCERRSPSEDTDQQDLKLCPGAWLMGVGTLGAVERGLGWGVEVNMGSSIPLSPAGSVSLSIEDPSL